MFFRFIHLTVSHIIALRTRHGVHAYDTSSFVFSSFQRVFVETHVCVFFLLSTPRDRDPESERHRRPLYACGGGDDDGGGVGSLNAHGATVRACSGACHRGPRIYTYTLFRARVAVDTRPRWRFRRRRIRLGARFRSAVRECICERECA